MTFVVHAPMPGRVLPLSEVPDPVFAASMMGPGCALDPLPGKVTVLAPCDGVLAKAMPHGYFVTGGGGAEGGARVLVHLGIDTVRLQGQGFTPLVDEGADVGAGQPIAVWDTAPAQAAGFSLCTPVVAMETGPAELTLLAEGSVDAGSPLFRIG